MTNTDRGWIDLRPEHAHPWGLQVPRNAVKSRIIYERDDYIVVVHACEDGPRVDTYHKHGSRDIHGGVISLYGFYGLRTKEASKSTPNFLSRLFRCINERTEEYTIMDAMRDAVSEVNYRVEAGRAALNTVIGAVEGSQALTEAEAEVESSLLRITNNYTPHLRRSTENRSPDPFSRRAAFLFI